MFVKALSKSTLALSAVALGFAVASAALAQTQPAPKAAAPAAKAATAAPAVAAPMHEITITIKKVRALDKFDGIGKADFYARVTVGGETTNTKRIASADVIQPDWQIVKKVPAGKQAVKIQMLDRDIFNPDDKIDINRVDKKRDLDFVVDTKTCAVEGFADSFKCGDTIKRAGGEAKKAEIEFTVAVKR